MWIYRIAEIFVGQKFTKPRYRWNEFCHYCKGRHTLCVIISTGQKIHRTKLLPTRPGGEIGKISGFTVVTIML